MTAPCDDCNGTVDVECVGGALWCKPCRDYFRSLPPLSEEDYLAAEKSANEDPMRHYYDRHDHYEL